MGRCLMHVDAALEPNVTVVRIEEALYFANIEAIKGILQRVEIFGTHMAHPSAKRETRQLRGLVLHVKHVPEMDATAVTTLYEMAHDYEKRHVVLTFVKLKPELLETLQRGHVLPAFPLSTVPPTSKQTRNFDKIDDAVQFIQQQQSDMEASIPNQETINAEVRRAEEPAVVLEDLDDDDNDI